MKISEIAVLGLIIGLMVFAIYCMGQDIVSLEKRVDKLEKIYGDSVAREVMIYDEIEKTFRILEEALVVESQAK